MKKKWLIPLVIIAVFVAAVLVNLGFQKSHTFTLSNEPNGDGIKTEQIQPIFNTVRVSVDTDTDVEFTDIETGTSYTIGYVTSGMSGKIRLEKGKWYTVKAGGNITIKPVNVRIVN